MSPSGDVVTGCADHIARVWTKEPARIAGAELAQLYQGRMSAATVSSNDIDGGVPQDKIEDPSTLQLPPAAGQTQKFVREASGAVLLSAACCN